MTYEIILSDELSHHGILGQHWGKRNGPPYPLEKSSMSSEEKRKNDLKSLKRQYSDARYSSAMTSKIDDPEMKRKSEELNKQLSREVRQAYQSFIDRYGDEQVKNLSFDGKGLVSVGQAEVAAMMNERRIAYTAIGTLLPLNIFGTVGGFAIGSYSDAQRKKEYLDKLSK